MMHTVPLRLPPGTDLRRALEAALADHGAEAAFVVAGIGSLTNASLRFAGDPSATQLPGPFEIVSLSGTLSPYGAHLHVAVADRQGRVLGGHAGYGNEIRTTAEILLALLPQWRFGREPDAATGYDELVIWRRT